MTDIDHILAERYDRRGFMRMAGATTLGAAVARAGTNAVTSTKPSTTARSNRGRFTVPPPGR